MIEIHNAAGTVVDRAESVAGARRLVDWYTTHEKAAGPYYVAPATTTLVTV
jgi:hypothetical protein